MAWKRHVYLFGPSQELLFFKSNTYLVEVEARPESWAIKRRLKVDEKR
jgi:hypothetical protein